MARADLLKKLFSSFNNDDRELFTKTAYEIINDERKKNHGYSVEWSLKATTAPIGVASYEIRNYLPTEEELNKYLK